MGEAGAERKQKGLRKLERCFRLEYVCREQDRDLEAGDKHPIWSQDLIMKLGLYSNL